jgi:hypothetical protein
VEERWEGCVLIQKRLAAYLPETNSTNAVLTLGPDRRGWDTLWHPEPQWVHTECGRRDPVRGGPLKRYGAGSNPASGPDKGGEDGKGKSKTVSFLWVKEG